jgi:hypothetical protein
MPQMWADMECTEHELSPRFFSSTTAVRGRLQNLGFDVVGFKKLRKILNPAQRDHGGINLIDHSRSHIAQVLYVGIYARPPIDSYRESVVVAFTARWGKSTLSYTNEAHTGFDSVPGHEVVRVASDDVAYIYSRFVDAVGKRKELPIPFSSNQELYDWFDSMTTVAFNHRVRRGLYVRMSDQEVDAALEKIPPPLPAS